ncbi:hypothetical protein WN943_003515 [Citrus x changshan-huyou]
MDLSNNNLTEPVPKFLSQLSSLKFLKRNLGRNKLTGPLPVELIGKQKNNALELGFRGNPELVDQQGKEELYESLELSRRQFTYFEVLGISPVEGGTHMSTTIAGTAGFLNTKKSLNNFKCCIFYLQSLKSMGYFHADKGDKSTVDLSFKGEFDIISVGKAVEIAMASVSSKVNRRPLMNQVVMMVALEICSALEGRQIKVTIDEKRVEASRVLVGDGSYILAAAASGDVGRIVGVVVARWWLQRLDGSGIIIIIIFNGGLGGDRCG